MTTLSERLRELSLAASECRWREFSMRVPADTDRDADIVLNRAAVEIDRLTAENAALREERDALVIKCDVADARLKLGVQKANEERDALAATLSRALWAISDVARTRHDATREKMASVLRSEFKNPSDILAARDARVKAAALREAVAEARWSGADRLADKLYDMADAIEKEAGK